MGTSTSHLRHADSSSISGRPSTCEVLENTCDAAVTQMPTVKEAEDVTGSDTDQRPSIIKMWGRAPSSNGDRSFGSFNSRTQSQRQEEPLKRGFKRSLTHAETAAKHEPVLRRNSSSMAMPGKLARAASAPGLMRALSFGGRDRKQQLQRGDTIKQLLVLPESTMTPLLDYLHAIITAQRDLDGLTVLHPPPPSRAVKESLGLSILAGASEVVVQAMKAYPYDADIQIYCCSAVTALARCQANHEANSRALGKLGACQAVMNTMAAFGTSYEVTWRACAAIHSLALDVEDNIIALARAGACEGVCGVMRSFPSDPLVQEHGCRALANLASSSKDNKAALRVAGACELVVAAMRTHPSNHHIQHRGCRAVAHLAFGSKVNKRALGDTGACQAVVQAMALFPCERDVQFRGCYAVQSLISSRSSSANNNNNDNRAELGRVGACERVVAAMSSPDFPIGTDLDLHYTGCHAVSSLAMSNEANKVALAKAGACEVVVKLLSTYPHHRDLQCTAVGALQNLASSATDPSSIKMALGQAGAVERVVEAMGAFPTDRDIIRTCCYALGSLALGEWNNKTAVSRAGARASVRAAMVTFEGDDDILKACRWSLYNMG